VAFAQDAKPVSNYNYNETFANNFYTKMQQKRVLQVVNQALNIGKTEQTIR